MNGRESNCADRRIAHERTVEHIDAVAIRAALAGTPAVLTAIEEGVAVTVCDIYCLDQAIVARGLGVDLRTMQRRILARRTQLLAPSHLALLLDALRDPADAVIAAVIGGDGAGLAAILKGADPAHVASLLIVLAARAGHAERAGLFARADPPDVFADLPQVAHA